MVILLHLKTSNVCLSAFDPWSNYVIRKIFKLCKDLFPILISLYIKIDNIKINYKVSITFTKEEIKESSKIHSLLIQPIRETKNERETNEKKT